MTRSTCSAPPPLLIYHHCVRPNDSRPPLESLPAENLSTQSSSIFTRKGNRSTRNPHPFYTCLSYHRLSPTYFAFVSPLSFVSIPKTIGETLSHPGWQQAMIKELSALHSSGTWELVPLLLLGGCMQ